MDNSQLIEEIRRGKALIKLGLLADARVLFQGLSAQPKAAYECALNLGLICFRQKEFGDAKKLFRRASKIEPKKFMPHYNLGVAFRELGDHESAIRSFKKAIGLDPSHLDSLENLIFHYQVLGQDKGAVQFLRRFLENHPSSRGYLILAKALEGQGQFAEQLGVLETLIEKDPLNSEARYVFGPAKHRFEGFGEHWANYHHRWSDPGYLTSNAPKNLPVPLYDHQHPPGQEDELHVLIIAEMGVGDEIMYLSGVRGLLERGYSVSASIDPRLVPAFKRTIPQVDWFSRQHFEESRVDWNLEEIDRILLLADIPRMVSSTDFGWKSSKSLKPQLSQIEHWRSWLESLPVGPKIGISWRGGGEEIVKVRRSVELAEFNNFIDASDAQFVSLQYDASAEEVELLGDMPDFHIAPNLDIRNDLEGLFPLISALDAVITVDNANAHFSGALGKSTLVLLPEASEWRWGTEGNSSLYESLELVRGKAHWMGAIKVYVDGLRASYEETSAGSKSAYLEGSLKESKQIFASCCNATSADTRVLILPDGLNWANWQNSIKSIGRHALITEQAAQSTGYSTARLISMPVPFNSSKDWEARDGFERFLLTQLDLKAQLEWATQMKMPVEDSLSRPTGLAFNLLYLLATVSVHRSIPVIVSEIRLSTNDVDRMPNDFRKLLAMGLKFAHQLLAVDEQSIAALSLLGLEAELDQDALKIFSAARVKCGFKTVCTRNPSELKGDGYSFAALNDLDNAATLAGEAKPPRRAVKLLLGARARADLRCSDVARQLPSQALNKVEPVIIFSESAFFPLLENAADVVTDDPLLATYCQTIGIPCSLF